MSYNALDEDDVRSLFRNAGIEFYSVNPITNQYDPGGPEWHRVTGPYGAIIIGWRKRVINIDWSGTAVRVELSTPNTSDRCHVHAWSIAEAGALLKQLSVNMAQWKRYADAIPAPLRDDNDESGFDAWMALDGRTILNFLRVEDYKVGEVWLRHTWKRSRQLAQEEITKQLNAEIRSEDVSRLAGG